MSKVCELTVSYINNAQKSTKLIGYRTQERTLPAVVSSAVLNNTP